MLQRVGPEIRKQRESCSAAEGTKDFPRVDESGAAVRIGDASFPAPFLSQLEFNAPVHGAWNIVHVGMLVPDCHQIYVCADNCMRGVVLTAAEMGASERFSCVLLEEEDLYEGSLENVTIEGVADAIRRLPYRPRAVMVFLVCLHHFVGTDVAYVYRTLEEQFPEIDFMRCWMDPVMRKSGLAPEQKLKYSMFRPIRPLPVVRNMVCDIGDNQPLDTQSDLSRVIEEEGFSLFQLHDCETYDDYLRMGAASLFITRSPAGIFGATQLANRLGRPFLYLPPSCGGEEIRAELEKLRAALQECRRTETEDPAAVQKPGAVAEQKSDAAAERKTATAYALKSTAAAVQKPGEAAERKTDTAYALKSTAAAGLKPGEAAGQETGAVENAEKSAAAADAGKEEAGKALARALALIGDTEVTLDHFATPRPLSLARLLLESGFHVTRVYLDAVTPEEKADFEWLQGHFPDLLLNATVHPKMRVLHGKENAGHMLAIGPKAAWFGGTAHFVNLVECGGLWGFTGIAKLAALMEDAYLHEKDTRELVPRKGFGCACVL
ncbi:MAG: nitrogenase component 1 [Eubacteriales bacterium]|nr:nitrogenase component 1 [Eubacteriales bacterium]